MLRRVLPSGRLVRLLDSADGLFLRTVPGLWRFCRYAVLTLRR